MKDGRRTADGVFDSVAHVHYAADLLNGVTHFRCPLLQQIGVRREQLDLHGFRRIRQVADHVLQHLDVFDFQAGFLLLNLGAQLRDDFFAAAAALALELYGNVATVGFGDGSEAQLQTGAARCAFDFGDFTQNLLNVADHAVGLLQRSSGGRKIVDDEAAFIHRREAGRCQALCRQGPRWR